MEGLELLNAAEPSEHLFSLDPCRPISTHRRIRCPGPIAEIGNKSMALWVSVDVGGQLDEVRFAIDLDAMKAFFEQSARAPIHLVVRLGIGVEEIRECLSCAGICRMR